MFKRIVHHIPRGCRSIHSVPTLAHQDILAANGVPGLYSAQGFQRVWTDYQNFLTQRLTQLTIETENETRVPFQIAQNTAGKADMAPVFNFASQAFNNHFFVESLNAQSNSSKPSVQLLDKIEKTWGSLDALKQEFLGLANSVLGEGWVFLVENGDKSVELVTCLNAGSPFTAHRQQSFDMNGMIDVDAERGVKVITEQVEANQKNQRIALLAANLWEYAYIDDYSVAGRSEYLAKWWDTIDWNVVNSRYFSG